VNAKRASRQPRHDDARKSARFRPNPIRQALYAAIVLGAILAGYLIVNLADAWNIGEGPPAVVVSLPIAEKPPPPRLPKSPLETKRVKTPVPAIFPEPNEENGEQARAYEESLPTEVYVPAPAPTSAALAPATKSSPENEPGATERTAGQTAVAVAVGTDNPASAPTTAENSAPEPTSPEIPAAAPAAAPAATMTIARVGPVEPGPAKVPERPMIAIVIDDMGVDRRRSRRILDLKGPLTVSFLTYADDLAGQTAEARGKGHELMLHLPMEPGDHRIDPGPNVLLRDIEPDELRRRIVWGLNRFQGYAGVNNHMGSKFTSDRPSMAVLMQELKRRNIFFLDSRTSGKTVGSSVARRFGVPVVERNVFLDNDNDFDAVKARLAETERLARRRGTAIAIGHPRDGTLAALSAWLPTIEARGFDLVPLTVILARSQAAMKPDRVSSSWRPAPDSSAR
jgi:uncharacterized protein